MNEWGPGLATILGIVEGLTEFLPVSSTGHLILVGHVLGFDGELAASAEISIQLGAILAVIAYERHKLLFMIGQAGREQQDASAMIRTRETTPWSTILRTSWATHKNLWFLIGLGLAFLPAAAIGFLTHNWIKSHLFSKWPVVAALAVGGVAMIVVERRRRQRSGGDAAALQAGRELGGMTYRAAFIIGLAQCLAMWPGTSRSMITIVAGLMLGFTPRAAAEFSFLLALPTLGAATLWDFNKNGGAVVATAGPLGLMIGFVVSCIVAWITVEGFLAFLRRRGMESFGWYRIALAIVVVLVRPNIG